MSDIEYAYLAGLLDGEGSCMYRYYENSKPLLCIQIGMTDRDIILWVKSMLENNIGVKTSYWEYQPKYIKKNGERTSLMYYLAVYGKDRVDEIYKVLSPYFRILNKKYDSLSQR